MKRYMKMPMLRLIIRFFPEEVITHKHLNFRDKSMILEMPLLRSDIF